MVDRFRHLRNAGKGLVVLLIATALAGCYLGGRRMFVEQPLVAPEPERAGDSYSVEITRSEWVVSLPVCESRRRVGTERRA